MTLFKLHLLGSPVLRQRSDEVEVSSEIEQLVKDLYETMYAAQGIGLAANQVGIAKRVAVVDVVETRLALINPTIVEREGNVRSEEGCLSIPDIYADVDRAERIVVEITTLENDRQQFKLTDLAARAVQHEVDHLDGVLFLDHIGLMRRRMLLKKWKKARKGEKSYIQDLTSPKRATG